nr:leucine zipper domain-containing protein [Cyanobium sp. Candia 9D4]
MHSHPNARLTQRGRLRLVIQHLEHGRRLAELAAENGISLRCAYPGWPGTAQAVQVH